MEDLLHGQVVVRLEKAQSCRSDVILELPVKVHRGEGSFLQQICFTDFERAQVNLLLLLVQDEYVAVVACAPWWERPEVGHNCLATRHIISLDVCTERWENDEQIKYVKNSLFTYTIQCTTSLLESYKLPSGFVRTSVHRDLRPLGDCPPENEESKSTVGALSVNRGLMMFP